MVKIGGAINLNQAIKCKLNENKGKFTNFAEIGGKSN